MENEIFKHRQAVVDNIYKSFEDNIQKAHYHGEIHPNGKWYWDSNAAKGKGDWRVIKKKTEAKTDDETISKKNITQLQDLIKKYESENSEDLFWKIYDLKIKNNALQLTKPQKKIIERLKSGDRIVVDKNDNWRWNNEEGGRIYHPFWNTIHNVVKFGVRPPKGFVLKEKEWNKLREE